MGYLEVLERQMERLEKSAQQYTGYMEYEKLCAVSKEMRKLAQTIAKVKSR